MKNKSFIIFIGILSGLLFGIATPFSKILLEYMNSFQLAGLLYLGSGIFAFCVLLYKHLKNSNRSKDKFPTITESKAINKEDNHNNESKIVNKENSHNYVFNLNNLKIILVLVFGGVLGPLFLMLGLSMGTATSTSVWLNMELVATAILGYMIFKDHIDRYTLIGLILTFLAGISISLDGGIANIPSIICIIAACFSWGVDNQLTSIIDSHSPEFITFLKGIVGGSINFIIGMFLPGMFLPNSTLIHNIGGLSNLINFISLDIIILALILGVISYGISIVLYVMSAQNLGATRSQILFSTAPFWGILFSIAILHEPFTLELLFSVILLIGGIISVNLLTHEHEHEHKEIEHIHLHSHDDEHHSHFHDSNNKKHSHTHKHEKSKHKHKHFPDLHHKHNHNKSEKN